MSQSSDPLADLDPQASGRFLMDMFHRIIVHYALWFTEVRHQLGPEKALQALETASQRSFSIQMNRLAKVLDFEVIDGLPKALVNMTLEKRRELAQGLAANWLANDGVWFQAVEFEHGMNDAKRCNDSCWAQFSPFEAWSIKAFLGLSQHPGLEGLKTALGHRMYALINRQSIVDEGPGQFLYRMDECRVQAARKRKGLEDYPCKSGGLVEYTYFARTIDPRIKTECVVCPPDETPADSYCAWRFSLDTA